LVASSATRGLRVMKHTPIFFLHLWHWEVAKPKVRGSEQLGQSAPS